MKGVYLTGTFTSPSITIGTNTLFKTGASDPMFIAEYDVSGNVLCATSLDNGVPDYDNIMDIATDSFGQMFLAGDYAKNPLIIGSNSLPLTGTYNSFSAKFTCGPPLPYAQLSASVTATSAACSSPNGSATATATGGSSPYTFQWSNSQTAQTATGLAAGNYTVTITDANGCSVSSTATITAAASPTVAVSSSPASCSSPTGSATATVSGGNSPYTYNWSSGATTSAATNLSAGNYSVTVTDNSGCTATATVSVSAIGAPTVTATFSNPLCNAGTNGTATATVNGGSSPYTFSWSSGQTTSVATNLSAGNYSVTVTDNSGCSSTQTVMLTQPNAISVSPSSTANTSCVSPNGSATANASGGTSPFTYSWSNGGTTSQISNLTSQIYSVTITDNNGCTATQTVSVAGPTLPTISISGNANITSGQSITISTSASGGNPSYTYAWSPSTGLSCISCANAVATLTETTTYCILITDANGCSDSSCITINVEIPCKGIYVPNAFSPNTDNENDFFRVYFGNILCVKEFKMVVYDRWGEKVFTTADAAFMWDGMYNGTLMQSGVFTYYMYARFDNGDEVNKKGNVTLLK
ncbi:MAG: gliding motility-associated C-terminal domain-containing protein [Bacteroidetes bacterium]|nr:gliding motility-associated C-terminal domain-containing protein [Bacteroidota bacterium]